MRRYSDANWEWCSGGVALVGVLWWEEVVVVVMIAAPEYGMCLCV